jgi:hypothetical protein
VPTDTELSNRIERNRLQMFRSVAEGADLAGVPGPNLLETESATAIYAGDSSPITQVVGIKPGFNLNEITEFYRGRTKSWEAAITPFAGAEPVNTLLKAGGTFEQFENINYRFLHGDLPAVSADIEIREVTEAIDCDLWSSTVSRGFHGDNTNEVTDLLDRVSARMTNTRRYLAYVDGRPAAGAALLICEDAVFLGGASTLKEFRGRGLHSALIAHRLQNAPGNCDLAVMQASPGSQSQANIQRFGFNLAYTQFSLRLELAD